MQSDDNNFSSDSGSEPTRDAGSPTGGDNEDFELPGVPARSSIGRFEIVRQLGKGGFGFVYLAEDPTLNRQVAIKVPRWDRSLTQNAIDRFQDEGRMLAQVNHASIVSVYDVATTDDGVPFVVMEYIQGETLSSILKQKTLTIDESLELLLAIAEALKQAHKSGLVHRDFKPGNVIIQDDGKISLVDFGLALHDDLSPNELQNAAVAGTPPYMAPEQLRGENHLIGGQTDIWAFGVAMYRMLVGTLPFKGAPKELSRAIRYKNPRPLRQLNEQIPKQLECICLRCLQKLMDDRYQSMADVIEELNAFMEEQAATTHVHIDISDTPSIQRLKELAEEETLPAADSRSKSQRSASETISQSSNEREVLSVIPKSLRSFDQNDREFFLKLLPGPTDRHGIPESIRFWISRLDQTQQIEEVNVGIIYGPSGCGKSSFVRAGLIPRLSDCVIPIYVDCTNEDLTSQIVKQIQQDVHSIPEEITLVELLQDFRRGKYVREGDKLLLVLDQFEQWLNGNIEYAESELANALRQCDSKSIQALLLLRDEFWLSASQFMKCLDQRIEESRNAMALPLFDQRHARRVLEAFGRAYERLPNDDQKLSAQQTRFVQEAVSDLSNRGKVICVHLAVFAETVKNEPWNYADLKSLGGWEGIGREFVSGIFKNPETPIYIKKNSADAWAILKQLLPASETELKGKTVTRSELRIQAGLGGQPTKFDELIEFLEIDSKLISRFENTDAIHDRKDGAGIQSTTEQLYGLTHDFLVKPIRAWGMEEEGETKQGRANILLSNLSEQWTASNSDRYLPSDWDFGRILLFGSSHKKKQHAEFWNRSKRKTTKRSAVFGSVLVIFLTMLSFNRSSFNQVEANRITDNYLSCEPHQLRDYEKQLTPILTHVRKELKENLQSPIVKRRTRAAAALLRINSDQSELRRLIANDLVEIATEELGWYQNQLAEEPQKSINAFDEFIGSDLTRVTPRVAIFSATFGDPKWLNHVTKLAEDPYPRLDTIDEISLCQSLIPALLSSFEDLGDEFDHDAISCFCCGLSQIKFKQLSAAVQNRCNGLLTQQYMQSKDSCVHTAALFALSKWKLEIPIHKTGTLDSTNWCELRLPNVQHAERPHRILFVKIEPGKFDAKDRSMVKHSGVVEHEFWIGSFEIASPLYQQFFFEKFGSQHSSIDTTAGLIENCAFGPFTVNAANNVLPENSFEFIKWLKSKREDMTWVNCPSDFFELEFAIPSPDEFELATRAKSETPYFFGDSGRAGQYVGKAINTYGLMSGQFLPNGFGVHDVAANVTEWVDQPGLRSGFFATKSTSDADSIEQMRSDNGVIVARNYPHYVDFGFRIVMRKIVQ